MRTDGIYEDVGPLCMKFGGGNAADIEGPDEMLKARNS